MKFYHCFYTDLPDQFVEANANRLIKWVSGWNDKNRYYRRHVILDNVALNISGDARKDDYPTIAANSTALLNRWLTRKGHLYNGRYWESLTEDQCSPARIASGGSGGMSGPTFTDLAGLYSIPLGAVFYPTGGRTSRRIVTQLPQGTWRLLNAGDFESAPKPPLRRDAIIAGEIIGYRCWRIENNLLSSVYQSDIWLPRQVLEGREIGEWNSRGIHAWKDKGSKEYHDYIRGYLNPEYDPYTRMMIYGNLSTEQDKPAMLTGTVFLWGDVVEHERGYRAEFARVRSLDWLYPDAEMMGREQEVLDELRQRYGVENANPI